MAGPPLSRGQVLTGWWRKDWGLHPGSAGTLGRGTQAPQPLFPLCQTDVYMLTAYVVMSARRCARVNSRVFTLVILTTALGGGNCYCPHFPDEDTEAQQLA